MAGGRIPGPLGVGDNQPLIDRGTHALTGTPAPTASGRAAPAGPSAFEAEIAALGTFIQAQAANAGAHMVWDAAARDAYARQIRALADELRDAARSGRISWAEAAEQARTVRETTMELVRSRSSPVGRAAAQGLKPQSPSLNTLVAKKTVELFGAGSDFTRLSPAQQNQVYAAVVQSAGKANPRVTAAMQRLSRAGRGLIVLSLAISVYNVAVADDKLEAAGREVAVTGAGVLGGVAGGALAGLACGPGAPVCVTLGAFAGGALAAFGVDWLW